MKTLASNSLIFLLILGMWSCTPPKEGESSTSNSAAVSTHPKGQASVSDDVSDKNILQVAVSSEAHSTLVAAVEAAQIEHVLVNAGPLTVFAPTNSAFEALPDGTVENLLKPENKGQLANILTRHAAPGSYDIEALKKEARKGRKLYMATGDYLEVVVDGDNVSVGGAAIVATIPTSNGIIHVVEQVILPN
ncbi:fasciclin domain-containing protein [Marinoscillum sp. MHG1-6]|uniref:fasciclin domain-containing protein n=1 Tax=Marinoscillum sp. MHG1-6 TaxID=2959627 RepID=UPI0021572B6F|nr:fasciclin domain-containing protein [Marinoscillum sp. MHG1-6]